MNIKLNELQTPFFLINKDKIDELLNDMKVSLKKLWPKGIIGYSFKTNNLPWIINYMKQAGLYAEVVSSDEFNLAESLDFPYKNIIFNGPVKGKDEVITALQHETIINIDSKREIEWIINCSHITAEIGLRVNFDLEKYCPDETQCGNDDGRFGFSYEMGELAEAIKILQNHNIPISGLHLHCSSKTRSLNIYNAIAKMAVAIVKEYNLTPSYIDIGGGFFGGVPGKPTFDNYFQSVHDIFSIEPRLKDTNLIIEPGMSLIGASLDYVSSVVDIKNTVHNKFVITDGSRIHVDPLMRKKGYTYTISYNDNFKNRNTIQKQTLCGFTCMENDRFFQLNNTNELNIGDKITFEKVGAYTMCLSPLFIQFFPAVYLRDSKKEELICVRNKIKASDFIKL